MQVGPHSSWKTVHPISVRWDDINMSQVAASLARKSISWTDHSKTLVQNLQIMISSESSQASSFQKHAEISWDCLETTFHQLVFSHWGILITFISFLFVRNLFATAHSSQVQPVPVPEDVAIVKKSLHLKTALPLRLGLKYKNVSLSKVGSTRLGLKGVVAGPRRPGIPTHRLQCSLYRTLRVLWSTGQTYFLESSTCGSLRCPAPTASERHNKYASYMKAKRKRQHLADWQDVN